MTPRVFAIVPAAGKSERMGRAKLALPLGGSSTLERVLASLERADLDGILVVLGPATSTLAPFVGLPATALVLERQTPDMRATFQAGLEFLQPRLESMDAILLVLADQPTLSPGIARKLALLHRDDPTRIRIPVCAGRRGHPLLLPAFVLGDVARLAPDQGIDALVRSRPDLISEWATTDGDVLTDMDYPEDYERLQARSWD